MAQLHGRVTEKHEPDRVIAVLSFRLGIVVDTITVIEFRTVNEE